MRNTFLLYISLFSVLLFLLLFFIYHFCPREALALTENFNTYPIDGSIWQVNNNDGTLNVHNGVLKISAGQTSTFPFIYSKINPFSIAENFIIKFKIKYNRATTKGVGLNLSTEIPPNGCSDPSPSNPVFSRRYFLGIWQDSINGLYLQYCGNCYNKDCSTEPIVIWERGGIDLEYHNIEIQYIGEKYHFFVDGIKVFSSSPVSIKPTSVWFGNPSVQGAGHLWTNFEIDYIYTDPNPIIFLPGMGSCWNEALFKGTEADSWILPAPVHGMYYQDLTDSFVNAGLEKDEDWYLFCYDWRKTLEENAVKLNEYINTNLDPPEKVNLVGHSMGGLISRIYGQNHPDKVSKIITLGSPHQGAVRAYPAWEGGQFWEYEGISKLLLEILIHTNKKPDEHSMHTIRRTIPSLKEILPTFDFLIDQRTGLYKKIADHHQQNETLNTYNQSLTTDLKNNLGTVYGNSLNTFESIKVTSISSPHANWVHQRRGLWEDGEPTHTCPTVTCEFTDAGKDYAPSVIYSDQGDKTVLVKSATINGVDSYEILAGHGELAKIPQAIQYVFDQLGIDGSPATTSLNFWEVIAFWIRSPAKIMVIDPDQKEAGFNSSDPKIENSFYDDEANFLLIPNPIEGNYQLKITGTDQGAYRLLTAKLNDNQKVEIVEYEFPTNEGKVDKFLINPQQTTPSLKDPDGLVSLKSAQEKIKNIQNNFRPICANRKFQTYLNKADQLIQKGKYQKASRLIRVTFWLFNKCFFRLNDEQIISLLPEYQSASDDLINAYAITAEKGGQQFSFQKIQKALQAKEKLLIYWGKKIQRMTDKGIKVSLFRTILFEKSGEMLEEAKEALNQQKLAKVYLSKFQIEYLLANLRI